MIVGEMCSKSVEEAKKTKEENEPQSVFKTPGDLSEDLHPEQREGNFRVGQEEPEPRHVKEEEGDADLSTLPFHCIIVQMEGDGDHSGGSQTDSLRAPLSNSDDTTSHAPAADDDDEHSQASMSHMMPQAEMACEPSAKLCDDRVSSRSAESVAESTAKEERFAAALASHTGEKAFSCSVCGGRNLKSCSIALSKRIFQGAHKRKTR
ncbi:uncharacterized protein LOC133466480 isoform X2 [Phyllopteryx taeniolatus]|uniref:uncharacterized protein LOC133466480 isoform X2 n=1 Tax=Phyllopteryx taeniolatus TaxID=161469 RepID=UPI002AD2D6E6|nr:uncharacterized protein LOC133466480 isoform X2 [Phyllopteryx taeniolatus]